MFRIRYNIYLNPLFNKVIHCFFFIIRRCNMPPSCKSCRKFTLGRRPCSFPWQIQNHVPTRIYPVIWYCSMVFTFTLCSTSSLLFLGTSILYFFNKYLIDIDIEMVSIFQSTMKRLILSNSIRIQKEHT